VSTPITEAEQTLLEDGDPAERSVPLIEVALGSVVEADVSVGEPVPQLGDHASTSTVSTCTIAARSGATTRARSTTISSGTSHCSSRPARMSITRS
jgi:hypothetical protein